MQTLIDPAILRTHFACDIAACKGACCTFPGGLGAPVLDDETGLLHEAYRLLRSELPPEHTDVVERDGLFERNGRAIHLRCYQHRACVFVAYEGEVAVCAIQRAWLQGRSSWIKPQSCHLFPIRITPGATTALRFEEFSECSPALRRGDSERIRLVDFLSDAIDRTFGPSFTQALRDQAE